MSIVPGLFTFTEKTFEVEVEYFQDGAFHTRFHDWKGTTRTGVRREVMELYADRQVTLIQVLIK